MGFRLAFTRRLGAAADVFSAPAMARRPGSSRWRSSVAQLSCTIEGNELPNISRCRNQMRRMQEDFRVPASRRIGAGRRQLRSPSFRSQGSLPTEPGGSRIGGRSCPIQGGSGPVGALAGVDSARSCCDAAGQCSVGGGVLDNPGLPRRALSLPPRRDTVAWLSPALASRENGLTCASYHEQFALLGGSAVVGRAYATAEAGFARAFIDPG